MNVGKLREYLSEYDDDVEVRLQIQQHYPLESYIYGLTDTESIGRGDEEEDEPWDPDVGNSPESNPIIVYLVEGSQVGYGTRTAWDTAVR